MRAPAELLSLIADTFNINPIKSENSTRVMSDGPDLNKNGAYNLELSVPEQYAAVEMHSSLSLVGNVYTTNGRPSRTLPQMPPCSATPIKK
jgi:hypothetical protein